MNVVCVLAGMGSAIACCSWFFDLICEEPLLNYLVWVGVRVQSLRCVCHTTCICIVDVSFSLHCSLAN